MEIQKDKEDTNFSTPDIFYLNIEGAYRSEYNNL